MEFIFNISICFLIFSVFVGILSVCAFLADYVLPKIPAFQRLLDSFEDFDDDEEVYREYLELRERDRRRNHRRSASRRVNR